MSTFGKIDEFQVNDDWSQYIERLGHYFTANDISDTVKQKSILLSVVGAETYKLIHNLSVPNLPGTKTYEELVELVKDYSFCAHNQTLSFNAAYLIHALGNPRKVWQHS